MLLWYCLSIAEWRTVKSKWLQAVHAIQKCLSLPHQSKATVKVTRPINWCCISTLNQLWAFFGTFQLCFDLKVKSGAKKRIDFDICYPVSMFKIIKSKYSCYFWTTLVKSKTFAIDSRQTQEFNRCSKLLIWSEEISLKQIR